MRYIIIIFLGLCSFSMTGQSNAKDYIERYKSVALQQMIETDIPASILLAQGILESSVGSSILSAQANNHFTMSCGSDWEGEVLYKLKDGVPKCYKVYSSPAESYIDHAKWLANNPEFENLFYIEPTNYKRWARGLQALEYKDYEDYAGQLVQVIELYELYNVDKELAKYQDEAIVAEVGEDEPIYLPNEDIYYNNGVKAVLTGESETPLELAARMKIPLRQVLKYNDIELSDGFYPGQYVYLKNKKSKFHGEKTVHEVQTTDNIYLISQQYGIRLNKLLKLNRLKNGEEPRVNEKIYLKDKNPQKPFLRSDDFTPDIIPEINKEEVQSPVTITKPPSSKPTENVKPPKEEVVNNNNNWTNGSNEKPKKETTYVYPDDVGYGELPPPIIEEEYVNNTDSEVGNMEIPGRETVNTKNKLPIEESTIPIPNSNKPVPPNVHVVIKGETLYSISKLHNVTVQRLKDLNGLLENTIEIDQWIRFK